MSSTVVLDGECRLKLVQDGGAKINVPLDGECGTVTQVKVADYYTGETTVTPSSETQQLATAGLVIPTDIIIEPIPKNYGLISWSGLGIRVS